MRASDEKSLVALRDRREQIIAQLSEAFARDALDVDEFERRLGLAHRAEAPAELDPLLDGIDVAAVKSPAPAPQAMVAAPRTASPARVRDKQTIVAVMGGAARKGSWTPARRLRVWTVMGGAELDFREATFAPGVTELFAFAFWGGAHIIVPPSLAVEMEGVAIMGGFDNADRAPVHDLDPDRPLLRVTGFAMMGGVNIETRLPGESSWQARKRRRKERKEQRKRHQRELEGQASDDQPKLLRAPRRDPNDD